MIFLQAATRTTGPASALLELAEIGELELFISDACLEEIRDVLTRPSLQRKFPSLTIFTVGEFMDRIQFCSVHLKNVASAFVMDRDPKLAQLTSISIKQRTS
jgi:predicted nucleic acid-binding protein